MMRSYPTSSSAGFTLIELLTVISIIGLLASIMLASLTAARQRGIEGKITQEIHDLQLAVESYQLDHGTYPFEIKDPCDGSVSPDPLNQCSYFGSFTTMLQALKTENFVKTFPIPPTQDYTYEYY